MSGNKAWLREAKWGVFIHYLAAPAGHTSSPMSAEEWNRRVDAVDVERLAAQLAAVGAGYCFLTVGQNSGHFCAPNAACDAVVGVVPSKCSRRDLIGDLHGALATRGIRLGVYAANAPPACDPVAVARFGWEWGHEGGMAARGYAAHGPPTRGSANQVGSGASRLVATLGPQGVGLVD
jgi:hypothetical protein